MGLCEAGGWWWGWVRLEGDGEAGRLEDDGEAG